MKVPMELPCDYCARERPLGLLDTRKGELVCKDEFDCGAAEERGGGAYVANLRRRQREGDELTDAEAADLRAG